jgi:hypothetical protein
MEDPNEYALEEQLASAAKMRAVSSAFYGPATQTGCHAFIEFCGLMNEYIVVCENTARAGGDFMMANTHNERPLAMKAHHAAYLAEKLDCIFGPTIRANPEARRIFESWLLEGKAP